MNTTLFEDRKKELRKIMEALSPLQPDQVPNNHMIAITIVEKDRTTTTIIGKGTDAQFALASNLVDVGSQILKKTLNIQEVVRIDKSQKVMGKEDDE